MKVPVFGSQFQGQNLFAVQAGEALENVFLVKDGQVHGSGRRRFFIATTLIPIIGVINFFLFVSGW